MNARQATDKNIDVVVGTTDGKSPYERSERAFNEVHQWKQDTKVRFNDTENLDGNAQRRRRPFRHFWKQDTKVRFNDTENFNNWQNRSGFCVRYALRKWL
jgi:hypothetical protein